VAVIGIDEWLLPVRAAFVTSLVVIFIHLNPLNKL